MTNIYQAIWDADQQGNGIKPLLSNTVDTPDSGFVKVNVELDSSERDLKVLTEVKIPESKKSTYELCRLLFNNYALPERDSETTTPIENQEINDLVHAMIDTPPMIVAKDYVQSQTGTQLSRDAWFSRIMELWFRSFSQGGDPELTGFEHVVVGEQEGSKAQGYHFWYKYYLDDGFASRVDGDQDRFPGLIDDRISYLGSKLSSGQSAFPESVTISYRWAAPDYDRDKVRPLTKKIGGFFVGCSVEGLLALGTVRAHSDAGAPKIAAINGARYNMKVFRSPNNRHVRTFYPMFMGADPGGIDQPNPISQPVPSPIPSPTITPVIASRIRIIAALVNPHGNDVGLETVTLINTGDETVALNEWKIVDKNGRFAQFEDRLIEPGDTSRIQLERTEAQLSNKGGSITLQNAEGQLVHMVSYSKSQAKSASGLTLIF